MEINSNTSLERFHNSWCRLYKNTILKPKEDLIVERTEQCYSIFVPNCYGELKEEFSSLRSYYNTYLSRGCSLDDW